MSDLKPTDKISHNQIVVKYDGKTFGPYPNPQGALTIEIVQRELAKQFPEAAKCEVSQKLLENGQFELTFIKKAGTKGNGWSLRANEYYAVYDGDNHPIALIPIAEDGRRQQTAKIVAAAPDLLAACEIVLTHLFDDDNECVFCGAEPYPDDGGGKVYDHGDSCPGPMLRAAVAKARGYKR